MSRIGDAQLVAVLVGEDGPGPPVVHGDASNLPRTEGHQPRDFGGVGQALGPNTGVLFSEPQIEKIDILAEKIPG